MNKDAVYKVHVHRVADRLCNEYAPLGFNEVLITVFDYVRNERVPATVALDIVAEICSILGIDTRLTL